MAEKELTAAEIAEYRELRAEKDWQDTGVREIDGFYKCPKCLETHSARIKETEFRKFAAVMDPISGTFVVDKSRPPENTFTTYSTLDGENPPVHACEENQEDELPMVVLPPGPTSVFKDEKAERRAMADSKRRLAPSDTSHLTEQLEDIFRRVANQGA